MVWLTFLSLLSDGGYKESKRSFYHLQLRGAPTTWCIMLPLWTVCIPSNCKSTGLLTSPLNCRFDRGLATAKIKMPSAQLTFRTATDVSSAIRAPRSPALGAEQAVRGTHSWVFWLHETAIPPRSFIDTWAVPNTTKMAVEGLGPAFLQTPSYQGKGCG